MARPLGPLPPAAEGLLALARLRATCLRVGVTDVTVAPARVGGSRQSTAKLSPIMLPASAQVRLRRLVPGGVLREDLRQLVVPLGSKERAAEALRTLLDELVPPSEEPVRTGSSDGHRSAG